LIARGEQLVVGERRSQKAEDVLLPDEEDGQAKIKFAGRPKQVKLVKKNKDPLFPLRKTPMEACRDGSTVMSREPVQRREWGLNTVAEDIALFSI
jgi:hypothetical protein